MTHICVNKLTTIGSDNGLSPVRRQAIIWTNAGVLLIGPLGTNFNEILIQIHTFSFKEIHSKMPSGKWHPFCLSLNVLRLCNSLACYIYIVYMEHWQLGCQDFVEVDILGTLRPGLMCCRKIGWRQYQPLSCRNYLGNMKTYLHFLSCLNTEWDDVHNWHPFSWKTRNCLSKV